MARRKRTDDEDLPWVKWYFSDWKSEPGLRMCGLAARGLWMEMLSIMHEADPYGHLLINGIALTPTDLTNQVGGGVTVKDVEKLLAELKRTGVYSLTDDDIIYSRRMVRDKAKREEDRENGRRGGNPRLKGDDGKTPDNGNPGVGNNANRGLTPGVKAQKPEARSQKPEQLAGSGFVAERPPDQARVLLDRIISELSLDPQRVMHAGPLLELLRQGHGPEQIFAAIERIKPRFPSGLGNPLAWLAKALPDEMAKLSAEEAADGRSPETQRKMALLYFGIPCVGPDGKPDGSHRPRHPKERSWSFGFERPFQPGCVVSDEIAAEVCREIGLDPDTERKLARRVKVKEDA